MAILGTKTRQQTRAAKKPNRKCTKEGGQPRPEHKPKENAGPDQNRRNMQNPAVEKKEGDQMSNINKNLPSDQQKQADGAQDGKLPANKKEKFFNKNRKPKDGQG